MTKLAHKLGLSRHLEFQDVWSVTDEDLLAMIPRPVHAILFLFAMTENAQAAFQEDQDAMEDYEGTGPDQSVLWFPQIIGHACGLIGMLHCVSNGEAASHITPGSTLDQLVQAAIPVKPKERAQILYDSEILEVAHDEAAHQGDSKVPDIGDAVNYGFTAFVRGKDGHLWELDGSRKGPVDRGLVQPDEDILSERVLGLSVFPYINREKIDETRFSCIALVHAQS
jgi:ubiquitin carboxyl-terminal hydrolase L3